MPEAKGGGQEDQPHIQEAVAAWVQEGLDPLEKEMATHSSTLA